MQMAEQLAYHTKKGQHTQLKCIEMSNEQPGNHRTTKHATPLHQGKEKGNDMARTCSGLLEKRPG
jgi:hypothetical protein